MLTARQAHCASLHASWREQLIMALATPHALEFYGAIVALLWGLVTALDSGYIAAAPSTEGLLPYVGGHAWVYGAIPAVTGFAGLVALRMEWRWLRAQSAAASALFWWWLCGWFSFGPDRPVTSAVVIYGIAALAEAWVYVRVLQQFDDLVRDVRKRSARDGRAAERGD